MSKLEVFNIFVIKTSFFSSSFMLNRFLVLKQLGIMPRRESGPIHLKWHLFVTITLKCAGKIACSVISQSTGEYFFFYFFVHLSDRFDLYLFLVFYSLFYDPSTDTIYDYVDGIKDALSSKVIIEPFHFY